MAAEFDPYRNWLGIKSDERPPNHYDLLGVKLFEDRAELIDQASIKRIDLLQDISSGSAHLDSTQRILNEVSVARLCLLNKNKRERYELTVKKKMAGLESAEERIARLSKSEPNIAPPSPVPLQSLEDVSFESVADAPPKSSSMLSTQRKSRLAPLAKTFLVWAALIAFVASTLGGVYLFVAPRIKAEFEREAADEALYLESRKANLANAEQPDDWQPVEEYPNTPGKTMTQLIGPPELETNKKNKVIEERSKNDDPDHKPTPKTTTKQSTAGFIACYDATLGDPFVGKPDTVESPIEQGWTGNADPDESDINKGVFENDQPAWRNGDRRYDKTDFLIKLTDADYKAMWNRGWRLEVVAKPVKGDYRIGWGGTKQSTFFDEKPLHAAVTFSARKTLSVRPSGRRGNKKKVEFKDGFAKVVLEGQPKSTKFTFSVFEVKSNLKEREKHTSMEELSISEQYQGRISWATARGQNRETDKKRTTEASIQVRKVELSIPKQPKQ